MSEHFQKTIQAEKASHKQNLAKFDGVNPKDISEFFKGRVTDYESISVFLKQEWYSSERINARLPQLDFLSHEKEILDAIRSRGPFRSPEQLTQGIAEYLRERLSYDMLTAMDSANQISGHVVFSALDIDASLKTTFDRTKFATNLSKIKHLNNIQREDILSGKDYRAVQGKLARTLGKLYANDNVHLSSATTNRMLRLIEFYLGNGLPPELKQVAVALKKVLATNDQNTIESYISENFGDEHFRELLGMLTGNLDIANYWGEQDIYKYLFAFRTWVCRHFSSIAKKIYDKLWAEYFPDSELIYILNPTRSHAYNVLVYQDPDGKIIKKYLDLTPYISEGKELFTDTPPTSEDEILAKVNQDESIQQS